MAGKHIYQSLEDDGQIVKSNEPRPDLEELARWRNVTDTHQDDEDETETTPVVPTQVDPEGNLVGTGHTSIGQVDATHAGEGKGLPEGDPHKDWTGEQLDQYAALHELGEFKGTKAEKAKAILEAKAAKGVK